MINKEKNREEQILANLFTYATSIVKLPDLFLIIL